MERQTVFQEKKERERLQVQNALLSEYELPVLNRLLNGKTDIAVLDVGCNDGTKTRQMFSLPEITHVVGLEYNADMALHAQRKYGDGKFSFLSADVESDTFSKILERQMQTLQITGFDIIYLSFILMHLKNTEQIFAKLKPFLKQDGHLMIVDADDSVSTLTPDKNGLLPEFLHFLSQDQFAGKRNIGHRIPAMLSASGYESITVHSRGVSAKGSELEKKRAIFRMYFSFFPEDVMIFLNDYPHNGTYICWKNWLDLHYRELQRAVINKDSEIFMGTPVITCRKGN